MLKCTAGTALVLLTITGPSQAGSGGSVLPRGAAGLSYARSQSYACSAKGSKNEWYRPGVPYPCVDRIDAQTARNREVYYDLMHQAWVKGDLSVLEKYIEADTYDYSPLHPPEKGTKGFAGIVTSFRSALSNIQLVHTDMAEGDLVTHFWKLTGVHDRGVLFGVGPTGKTVELSGISTVTVKDGKVVARWSQLDIYGLLLQLGLAKPMK